MQHASAPRIAAEQRLIDSRYLLDLLPPDSYDNQPLEQPLTLDNAALDNSTLLAGYRATKAGQAHAVLLRSQTLGYAGAIDLLIAIDLNGRLLGVKTLKQTETPGLGARIADWPNAWLADFFRQVANRSGRQRLGPEKGPGAIRSDRGRDHHLKSGDQCHP